MTKTIRINSDTVRATCIRQNWYTRGTCEDYSNLLNNLCDKEDATDEDIMKVVYDIAEHTNLDRICKEYGTGENEVIANIAFYIYNDCLTTFIEL